MPDETTPTGPTAHLNVSWPYPLTATLSRPILIGYLRGPQGKVWWCFVTVGCVLRRCIGVGLVFVSSISVAACSDGSRSVSTRTALPPSPFSATSTSAWVQKGTSLLAREQAGLFTPYRATPTAIPMPPVQTSPITLAQGDGVYQLRAGPLPSGFALSQTYGLQPSLIWPSDIRQPGDSFSVVEASNATLFDTTTVNGQVFLTFTIRVSGLPAPYTNFSLWAL